jgi:hypothetical protein
VNNDFIALYCLKRLDAAKKLGYGFLYVIAGGCGLIENGLDAHWIPPATNSLGSIYR